MPLAIRIHSCGGPEQLHCENLDTPIPQPGEALVRTTAIGVNFIDVYQRQGLYPLPLPFIGGNEGAGIVEAIGPGVTEVAVGDRVLADHHREGVEGVDAVRHRAHLPVLT